MAIEVEIKFVGNKCIYAHSSCACLLHKDTHYSCILCVFAAGTRGHDIRDHLNHILEHFLSSRTCAPWL